MISLVESGASLLENDRRKSLDFIARDIHEQHGMSFPVAECGSRFEDCMEIITSRKEAMPQVRHDTVQAIRNDFGEDSDEAGAAKIVEAIGTDFDRIFFSQLSKKNQDPQSWRKYDPQHAAHLTETIDVLIGDPSLGKYFSKNTESQRMLEIIKHLASSDTDDLGQSTDELEKLAIAQYRQRKPVMLFLFSDWYLRPNRKDEEEIQLLEPDCRLIFPYEGRAYGSMIDLVETAKRDLAPFYPPRAWSEVPTGVIGDAVMWAGSQIVSYTVGEAFNSHGFMFAPNIIKTIEATTRILEQAGIPVSDNVFSKIVRQYVYHELGHSFFHPDDPFLAELATDIPTVITDVAQALSKSDEELTATIALLFSEYLTYAMITPTGEASSDGYRLSSIVIVNALLDHHLVRVLPDGKLHIHQDWENCHELINDLSTLHHHLVANDRATTEFLRAERPSQTLASIKDL